MGQDPVGRWRLRLTGADEFAGSVTDMATTSLMSRPPSR
jgi:hypothetical protein